MCGAGGYDDKKGVCHDMSKGGDNYIQGKTERETWFKGTVGYGTGEAFGQFDVESHFRRNLKKRKGPKN